MYDYELWDERICDVMDILWLRIDDNERGILDEEYRRKYGR